MRERESKGDRVWERETNFWKMEHQQTYTHHPDLQLEGKREPGKWFAMQQVNGMG